MIRFAATMLVSAFLLFAVQPMAARTILPWFGGGPAVWTTCMLFFQAALLAGYAYSHLVATRLTPARQYRVHLGLLAVSLLLLPITPSPAWRPHDAGDPTWRILLVLARSVGVPYLLVSSTAPLLQRWHALLEPGRSPYRLYALSNLGSLLGLVSYPVLIEPALGVRSQTVGWSVAYAGFAALCAWSGWRLVSRHVAPEPAPRQAAETGSDRATWGRVALWIALPAATSIMLLATTNRLCQQLTSIPFLWVLPLALYLVSFIVTFEQPRGYDRRIGYPVLIAALALVTWQVHDDFAYSLAAQVPLYSAVLFACCWTCHGELVRLRPAGRGLTAFYLMIALGGALGGVLVAIVAPRVLTGFWEFDAGLVFTPLLVALCCARSIGARRHRAALRAGIAVVAVAGVGLMGFVLANDMADYYARAVSATRDFYGILRVTDDPPRASNRARTLHHGAVLHGLQFFDAARRDLPCTYYSAWSGVGLAIMYHPRRLRSQPMNIGVVGLGTGTMAVWGAPGDTVRFYEIDPDVERAARRYFSYLADSRAHVEIVGGDARVSMEQELARGDSARYDVLALDAFSGDAIPVHLLTLEAMRLYERLLKPGGVLAVHISNRHLELSPVMRGAARALGKPVLYIHSDRDVVNGIQFAAWALITDDPAILRRSEIARQADPWPAVRRPFVLWTDDHSDLFTLLDP